MRLNILRSLRGGLLALVLSGGALHPAHALDLVIRTTANQTKLGFTNGQEVTFTFTINPLFVITSDSIFDGSKAVWASSGTEDIPIFSWIGISGVSGSFNPVIGESSFASLTTSNNGDMKVDLLYEGLGYRAGGESVFLLATSFEFVNREALRVPPEYIDPTAYFMDYKGGYLLSHIGFGLAVLLADPGDSTPFDYVNFTVTDLQIVPEPSSVILLSAGALGALWMARRRHAARV